MQGGLVSSSIANGLPPPESQLHTHTAFKLPSLRPLLSITVESPSCLSLSPSIAVHHLCDCSPSPLPSQSRCPLLYRRQGASAPSIAVEEPSRRPLTSRRAVHHRRVAAHCRHSVHCFQVSVAPSIAVHHCRVAVMPSITVHHPSLLSLSCAFHCCPCRRAVAVHHPPSITSQCLSRFE